jgi:hypothetical protein
MRVGYGIGRVATCTCGSRNILDAFKQDGQNFIKQHSLQSPDTIPVRSGDYVGVVFLLVMLAGFLGWVGMKLIS